MRNQDGSILALSLIFMLALIILVIALSVTLNNEVKIVTNEHNLAQAQYYAESVVEYASVFLKDEDPATASFWTGTGEVNPARIGEIKSKLRASDLEINSLRRKKAGESYVVSTNIRYKGVRDSLRVTFSPVFQRLGIFDFAMAAGINLQANGTVHVDGSIAVGNSINGKSNVQGATEMFEGLDIEEQLELLEAYLEEAVVNPGTISTASLASFPYVHDLGDRLVLDIHDKIIYITGNLTMDKHLYIMGSGILIIEGSLNQNAGSLLFANYDPDTGTYTDDFAVMYFRTGHPNPRTGNFKGMLMGKSDVNLITDIAAGFELVGSVFSGNNLNANASTSIVHDDGYVEVLEHLALNFNITILSTFKITDWMEF